MESFISRNRLILGITAGVVLGGAVGSFFPEFGAGTQIIGELFLNALKMVVLPLIIVSIALSIMKVGNLGSGQVPHYRKLVGRQHRSGNYRKA